MFETSKPGLGRSQRVTCTGYANAIQAVAGKCKTVMVQAREAVVGTSGADVTANTGTVIMYVGEAGVGSNVHTGLTIPPGQMIMLNIEDVSMLRFRGPNTDSVNIVVLF